MTEKSKKELKEIIARALRDPAAYPELQLAYERGHDLFGITHFQMQARGNFSLNSNNPRRQTSYSSAAELDAAQRTVILTSLLETNVLEVTSSSRTIGEDELPSTVKLSYRDLEWQIEVWAGDVQEKPDFHRFELTLWSVLKQLSQGQVGRGPI